DGTGLGMFEIAWIGVPVTIVGIVYMLVCTRVLLPERVPAIRQLDDPREYTVEMLVDPFSPLVGRSIEDAGLRHLPGMYLMEIDRDGHVLPAVSSNAFLQANDRLVFVGVVESVIDLQRIPGLKPATNQLFKLDAPRSERCLIEAVVSDTCPSAGLSIREAKFRSRYNAAVIAVSRNGQRINKKIGDIQLQSGDTLLLEAHPSFADVHRNSRDFYLLSRVEGSTPPRYEKALLARIILTAMVVVVATGVLSMLKAALLAAALMIGTRCCRGSQARASIDWSVLLTIGAGLGLGKAMEKSGAASFLAEEMITLAGSNPTLILAIVYGLTMVFTNLITAKAAAVLFFPIAIQAAALLDVSPKPFVMGLIVAAAASFATPIGYQTNLMVLSPGGYRTSDYLRIGGFLSLIVAAIAIVLVPIVWPF
ncbi:MAG: SLC13 family permease, partial [Planctomycetota bacterium]|nr:SLC13 family permease [Planctomycetota bacterium]